MIIPRFSRTPEDALNAGFYGDTFATCDRLGLPEALRLLAGNDLRETERRNVQLWVDRRQQQHAVRQTLMNWATLGFSAIGCVAALLQI